MTGGRALGAALLALGAGLVGLVAFRPGVGEAGKPIEPAGAADRASASAIGPARAEPAESAPEAAPRSAAEPAPTAFAPSDERRALDAPRLELSGRVVDADTGSGIEGARVALFEGERRLARASTDEEGRFRLRARSETPVSVRVDPPDGWIVDAPSIELALPSGAPILFVARAWPPPVAGDVRGRLVSERGAWTEAELPRGDELVLDLVSLEEPRIERRATIAAKRDAAGALALQFAFADVPRGNYELLLSSLDHHRWTPSSLVVAPPADNLEFLRYDAEPVLPLRFDVLDATSGERIADYEVRKLKQEESPEGMFLHAGPFDLADVPVQSAFRWSLWADGYAPAFGDEASFVERERDGERVRVAEVRLERGWGARLLALARTPVMRPVQRVEVWIDGELAGATGADGALCVQRAERPERIEVRGGWKLTNDPFASRAGANVEVRGYVLPLVLERVE